MAAIVVLSPDMAISVTPLQGLPTKGCLLSCEKSQPQRDPHRLAPISDARVRGVQSQPGDRRDKLGGIPVSASPWESLPACRVGRLREITARSEAQVTRRCHQQHLTSLDVALLSRVGDV
jgi:hypothetical protein